MTIKEELQSGAPLRALSWKEPYASLMLHGKVETRTWGTKYRGLVLICTTKKHYHREVVCEISGIEQYKRICQIINIDDLLDGYAIAIGRLIFSQIMLMNDEDRCFVQYDPHLYCHIYEEVTAIESIPWKGSQGWRTVSQEVINQIKFR